jgi:hypothetical protein
MPFVKLDCGILRSTIWDLDAETCKVWITLLTMAGPSGLVDCHSPGVAHEARLTVECVERCLSVLEAPDPRSRTKTNDGRRIERTDDGYLILNYAKYREKDYSTPRVAAFRKRGETPCNAVKRDETLGNAKNGYAYAEAEGNKKDSSSPRVTEFMKFWSIYPRKVGKGSALRAWRKVKPDEVQPILDAVTAQKSWSTFADPQFIPHPATWLNARRWEDAPPEKGKIGQPHPARRVCEPWVPEDHR